MGQDLAQATELSMGDIIGRSRAKESLVLNAVRDVIRNPMGAVGLTLVLGLVLIGLAAPLLARHDPLAQFLGHRLEGPSSTFWFGTDEFSRDLFSRTVYGLRASLIVSVLAVGVGGGIGVMLGFFAGYLHGWPETVIMRVVDTMLAFPGLLLAIAIMAALGGGIQNVALALGVGALPRFARIGRAQLLAERGRDYVTAAELLGASRMRVILRHIAPNALPPLLVQAAISMAGAVLVESSLGYLGLGTEPPQPSLGALINGARSRLDHPYYFAFPGACLALFLVGLNLLADAINEALDPHRVRR